MASLTATVRTVDLSEAENQRSGDRVHVDRQAVLRADGDAYEIRIEDLTRDGCRITTDLEVEIGSSLALGIGGVGQVLAKVVWRDGKSYGCLFMRPLPSGAVTAATLNNVTPLGVPQYGAARDHAPDAKFPLRQRALIIVGATSLLWVALIAAGFAMFH